MYPVMNEFRSVIELSGLWKFRIDPGDVGERDGWFKGFDSEVDIAVPGSWNEQLEEIGLLQYVGTGWYSREVYIPQQVTGKALWLRVGSADFHATVWVNGRCVGRNDCGFLPFSFPITDAVIPGEAASIVLRVNNQLSDATIPQGITCEQYQAEHRMREETYPPARFDFFPYGGIHRPVQIVITPVVYISHVAVQTAVSDGLGTVNVKVEAPQAGGLEVLVSLEGESGTVRSRSPISSGTTTLILEAEKCRCWSPEDPFLYTLTVRLSLKGEILDEYSLPIGIREIVVEGNRLLLNGKEIYLKGFGKHEDASIVGRGLLLPLLVKDFQLLKWIGANSFRTSHYPYAEELMFYADRKGILVIDEVPAVSLDFRHTSGETLWNHKEFTRRLIERDGNHPCVIMWALGNEPNLVGDPGYVQGPAREYWKEVFDYARELDPTRPLVVPNCQRAGITDPVLEFSDVICLNRYYGWYEYPGRLDRGLEVLSEEMDAIHHRYRKPLMMTEFGADTIPGLHATSDQMFTEEFQERLILDYIALIRSKNYTVGEHIWNFADFRTPQNMRRIVLNMKGVFTRTRSPKTAAFSLRKLWVA